MTAADTGWEEFLPPTALESSLRPGGPGRGVAAMDVISPRLALRVVAYPAAVRPRR